MGLVGDKIGEHDGVGQMGDIHGLNKAIELRKNNKPEEAMVVLYELLRANTEDPNINYQIAWTFDSMGKEPNG